MRKARDSFPLGKRRAFGTVAIKHPKKIARDFEIGHPKRSEGSCSIAVLVSFAFASSGLFHRSDKEFKILFLSAFIPWLIVTVAMFFISADRPETCATIAFTPTLIAQSILQLAAIYERNGRVQIGGLLLAIASGALVVELIVRITESRKTV